MIRSSASVLSGVWLSIFKGVNMKLLERRKKPFYENPPRKSFWQGTIFARHTVLLTATVVYMLIITVLLTVNSPGRFLSHFTSSGPALQSFAQAHQAAIHFFSFYILAALIGFCFRNISYFVSIGFMTAYAIVTELAQMSLPERHSDIFDLLANLAGIGCGIATVWATFRIRNLTSRH